MMDVRALHTAEDYAWALKEVEQYFDNVPASGTQDADRFDVLSTLIADYETRHFDIRPGADPIDVLAFAMETMGKTQADLGHLITRSRATEVLGRKRRLTLQMIRIISEAWRIPADALIGHYELDGETDPPKAEAHPRAHRARRKQVA
jgi:HTH-type transcriptional regulator/antitoxin HigA